VRRAGAIVYIRCNDGIAHRDHSLVLATRTGTPRRSGPAHGTRVLP
jgi:hypothetical protein